VGVIVPLFGHTAVARNVLKRRLRDLARTELLPSMPAIDAVIRAMPGAYALDFDALRAELGRVSARVAQKNTETHRAQQGGTAGDA